MNNEDRFWASVEKTDSCWNWTRHKDPYGYGMFYSGGRSQRRAHRISWTLLVGPIPDGMVIDHICHNKGCVNPDHLRACTQKQNQENRTGPQPRSKSGVRGVYWHKAARKWHAQVCHNREVHYVGLFEDLKDADAAVTAKRLELFTHNDLDRSNGPS